MLSQQTLRLEIIAFSAESCGDKSIISAENNTSQWLLLCCGLCPPNFSAQIVNWGRGGQLATRSHLARPQYDRVPFDFGSLLLDPVMGSMNGTSVELWLQVSLTNEYVAAPSNNSPHILVPPPLMSVCTARGAHTYTK